MFVASFQKNTRKQRRNSIRYRTSIRGTCQSKQCNGLIRMDRIGGRYRSLLLPVPSKPGKVPCSFHTATGTVKNQLSSIQATNFFHNCNISTREQRFSHDQLSCVRAFKLSLKLQQFFAKKCKSKM